MYKIEAVKHKENPEKEAIHSGHFMVSHFEAEAQDDEDELSVPVPEVIEIHKEIVPMKQDKKSLVLRKNCLRPQIGIDTSLSKLFQCMSLAYRQKLTSPKWNRFRGVRLRWKDKIRLNNVIWRCWHMQFIKKQNTLICQFASPLDVDTHNKPEAVVLEGKYWKRKLAAVTAEYKKWRMFYRNLSLGNSKDTNDMFTDMELLAWNSQNTDESMHMMVDEDYMGLMSDTLFSTITNQPFVFPDSREIAKAGLADFIQPSLGPLQPNLDDYMDTFEPFQDLMSEKLATVPEENTTDSLYKPVPWGYTDMDGILQIPTNSNMQLLPSSSSIIDGYQQLQSLPIKGTLVDTGQLQDYANIAGATIGPFDINHSTLLDQSQMISKNITPLKMPQYNKTMHNTYGGYPMTEVVNSHVSPETKVQATHQELITFKPSSGPTEEIVQGYKFTPPTTPTIKFSQTAATNVKFTSQISKSSNFKEEKLVVRPRTTTRGRPRSRSNTREPLKKPPLISATSDPSLLNSTNSALLTQLLSNSENNSAYAQNQRVANELQSVSVKDEMPIPILPQPTAATLIITTPVNMTSIHANLPVNDPLLLNTVSASNSPILDANQCLNSPTSSQGSMGSPTRDQNRDQRRVGHIHAEQKRRYNIKNGFDMMHSLIPHLNQNPNAKLSKAAILQKGAEYIKQLKSERSTVQNEIDTLRQEIETLNASISNCQSSLPATGAPVSRRRDNEMQEMFDDYVRTRTMANWKFWIFSLLFRPLLASFNNVVSTSSMQDLYRSTMDWVEQHCTLTDLRPVILHSLRYLCRKTDILSEPEKLPEEARQIVLLKHNQETKI